MWCCGRGKALGSLAGDATFFKWRYLIRLRRVLGGGMAGPSRRLIHRTQNSDAGLSRKGRRRWQRDVDEFLFYDELNSIMGVARNENSSKTIILTVYFFWRRFTCIYSGITLAPPNGVTSTGPGSPLLRCKPCKAMNWIYTDSFTLIRYSNTTSNKFFTGSHKQTHHSLPPCERLVRAFGSKN